MSLFQTPSPCSHLKGHRATLPLSISCCQLFLSWPFPPGVSSWSRVACAGGRGQGQQLWGMLRGPQTTAPAIGPKVKGERYPEEMQPPGNLHLVSGDMNACMEYMCVPVERHTPTQMHTRVHTCLSIGHAIARVCISHYLIVSFSPWYTFLLKWTSPAPQAAEEPLAILSRKKPRARDPRRAPSKGDC